MTYKRIGGKILALLLSSVMLLLASSCGLVIVNDVSGEQETETETEKANGQKPENKPAETTKSYTKYINETGGKELAVQYLEDLPERNYDGAVFFITTPADGYISPSDISTSVSKLAVERNAMVEDLLNISIITSVASAETMLTEVKQAIASDSYYTDLLMVPIYQIGQFRKEETLINLRSLPFFDLDQPYFNKESSDMTSGGYSTYGVAGDASISPSSFSAVYMNKNILESAGVDPAELYDMAEAGTWTLDKLLECTAAVTSLNESGTENMVYYTLTAQDTASRLPDLIFKAAGNDFIKTGTRKTPIVGYNERGTKNTMDALLKIYSDPRTILDSTAGAIDCFAGGESAFLVEYLSVMPTIASAKADWGVLPLPKNDEKDEYRTLIANTEVVFGVPVNHTNGEYAAITLSALNAASYGYIYDEYVNYSMLNVLRDNDSVNMLDIILDTASFDFALAFGNAYPEIANATYKLIRSAAKSGDLEEQFNDLRNEANAVMSKEFDLKY